MYIPHHVTQADGSTCQWTNCWAAVGAWLADGATHGRLTPSPSDFRRWARAGNCRTGGMGDLVTGLHRKGIRAHLHIDVDREHAKHLLERPDRLWAVPVAYDELPPDERCQHGEVDFYHMMGLVSGVIEHEDRGAEYRVMDPLCHRRHRIERYEMFRAAIAYGREHADGRTMDLVEVHVAQ